MERLLNGGYTGIRAYTSMENLPAQIQNTTQLNLL